MKKLVGLTGKTGSGKSTVSRFLEKHGAFIIDGDIVARQVLREGTELLCELEKAFGNVLASDGTLNRKALAEKAFSTPENTALLNSIMHPAINSFIEKEAQTAFSEYNVVVVDAAAIIESGFAQKCDVLIVVTAPQEVRKSRIISRDNISEKDALIRINGQKDDDFYLSKADYVIHNYEPHNLESQLLNLVKELF